VIGSSVLLVLPIHAVLHSVCMCAFIIKLLYKKKRVRTWNLKTNELYDTITVSCECKQQRIIVPITKI
jgi:hypothetical protein